MQITLVVAASDNNVIGRDGQLPWRIPEDLRRFRQSTMGRPILMGRRTFESIGRPLPGRRNIVISRQAGLELPGCEVVSSPEAALEATRGSGELMVIGGSTIYRYFLPLADRIFMTRVHAELAGDTHFPPLNDEEWRTVSSEPGRSAESGLAFTFETLERTAAATAARS